MDTEKKISRQITSIERESLDVARVTLACGHVLRKSLKPVEGDTGATHDKVLALYRAVADNGLPMYCDSCLPE